jgi:hypothetical protein
MDKKLLILQSNYIPWKGYFDMINMADEFIIYDEVQYTKNDWRNRNKIKTQNGIQWITIPVNHSLSQSIRDTKISDIKWNRKHWNMVSQSYAKARHFNDFRDRFESLYMDRKELHLSEINYTFIKAINEILNIKTRISWSSEYELEGEKSERLVSLCKQTGSTHYITGPAAKQYITQDLFQGAGIEIIWMDYAGYPEYNQLFPPFEHGVSALDLIFNEGRNANKFLKSFIH